MKLETKLFHNRPGKGGNLISFSFTGFSNTSIESLARSLIVSVTVAV